MIFTHYDRPGLIGFIGTTFGKHNVNIAQMNVGRAAPGAEAIGVVNLDSMPPAEAVDAVAKHPDVLSVSVIRLPAVGEEPPWLGV
jgi:D-3-phosphoglycerate dehydrogenase